MIGSYQLPVPVCTQSTILFSKYLTIVYVQQPNDVSINFSDKTKCTYYVHRLYMCVYVVSIYKSRLNVGIAAIRSSNTCKRKQTRQVKAA